MMAFVLGVILASIWETSMFQVSGSASTSTGTAPTLVMAEAQQMMVKAGMITSSPACTSA